MPSINMLMHIVYCLCNNLESDNPDFTDKEQYETQLNELLKEEYLLKKVVFKTAVNIVSEPEHHEYLQHVFRALATFSNMVECRLMKETDKDAPIVLLLEEAFDVIERLTTFFHDHFPDALSINTAHQKSNPDIKYKLGISVAQIGVFARALMRGKEIDNTNEERLLAEFIVRHFSSKFSGDISYKSLVNQIREPEPSAVDKVIEILEEMIQFLKPGKK